MVNCDVTIVGAGIVGSSLALALAQLPLNIQVIETSALPQVLPSLDNVGGRYPAASGIHDVPISLNLTSYQLFQSLGIAACIQQDTQPILQVHVSEQGRLGKLRFRATDMQVPALGYVISRRRLTEVLQARLMQVAQSSDCLQKNQLSVRTEARITALTKVPEGWQLSIHENTQLKPKSGIADQSKGVSLLKTRLLIAADGYRSQIRQLLNVIPEKQALPGAVLSAVVVVSGSHHQVAYERFTRQGVVALLPLDAKCRMGLVWSASPDEIEDLAKLPDQALLKRVQAIFGYRLGQFLKLSVRNVYPFHPFYAALPWKSRVVLLGNAACSLYPMTAQGLNMSLKGVSQLTSIITEKCYTSSLHSSDAEGVHPILDLADGMPEKATLLSQSKYGLTNALHHLFKLKGCALGKLRSGALLALDNLPPPLKKSIAEYFMY